MSPLPRRLTAPAPEDPEEPTIESGRTFSSILAQKAPPLPPPSLRRSITFTAEELQAMANNARQWFRKPDDFKVWMLVQAMFQIQIASRIASQVGIGRSGPHATLRAQKDFARSGLQLMDIIERVGPELAAEAQKMFNELLADAERRAQKENQSQ